MPGDRRRYDRIAGIVVWQPFVIPTDVSRTRIESRTPGEGAVTKRECVRKRP
jgi:hypothetical protein